MFSLRPSTESQMVVNMRASLATFLRGKNNVAMLCGDFLLSDLSLLSVSFLHRPFDCEIQNWGRTILHLAGQVCGQLVNYVQSHWLRSTIQPPFLRQLAVMIIRAAGTQLRGLEMS